MEDSIYTQTFDEKNVNWRNDSELNFLFLKTQENYANHMLKARGHVFLNDIYDQLGFQRTSQGQLVGWLDDGEVFIDFGIPEEVTDSKIELNFNVSGVIYEDI